MLAIIRKLENQKYLLESTKFKFKVWTNHKNLEYFMKVQKLNRRQAYYVLYLSRFNFILKYALETKIEKVDGLGKRPDQKVEVKKNNENQTLIKKQWICNLVEVVIKELKIEKIKIAREKDKEVARVVEKIKKAGVKVLRENKQQVERDLVLKEEKVYVLKDKELRVEIIWLYYDMLVAEHEERQKMIKLVTRNCWQPGVIKDMQKYIDKCNIYQKIKNCTEVLVGKLIVNEIPEKLWVYLTVDFITKLLLVVEKNMILVVCDRLSKISYFMATVEGTSAEGLTRLFRDNM